VCRAFLEYSVVSAKSAAKGESDHFRERQMLEIAAGRQLRQVEDNSTHDEEIGGIRTSGTSGHQDIGDIRTSGHQDIGDIRTSGHRGHQDIRTLGHQGHQDHNRPAEHHHNRPAEHHHNRPAKYHRNRPAAARDDRVDGYLQKLAAMRGCLYPEGSLKQLPSLCGVWRESKAGGLDSRCTVIYLLLLLRDAVDRSEP
jgi:hypothetical protein